MATIPFCHGIYAILLQNLQTLQIFFTIKHTHINQKKAKANTRENEANSVSSFFEK